MLFITCLDIDCYLGFGACRLLNRFAVLKFPKDQAVMILTRREAPFK